MPRHQRRERRAVAPRGEPLQELDVVQPRDGSLVEEPPDIPGGEGRCLDRHEAISADRGEKRTPTPTMRGVVAALIRIFRGCSPDRTLAGALRGRGREPARRDPASPRAGRPGRRVGVEVEHPICQPAMHGAMPTTREGGAVSRIVGYAEGRRRHRGARGLEVPRAPSAKHIPDRGKRLPRLRDGSRPPRRFYAPDGGVARNPAGSPNEARRRRPERASRYSRTVSRSRRSPPRRISRAL